VKADPDSPELTERQASLVLNALPGMGSVTRHRLLAALGGARHVLAAPPGTIAAVPGVKGAAARVIGEWRRHFDLAREEAAMAAAGVDFIARDDPAYPDRLRRISDPPLGLYRQGRYDFDRPGIAIVGTRKASPSGLAVARALAGELARLGYCVVSGLALGIDAAAHEGALAAGGRTAAVLGAGVDVIYPPQHRELHRRVAEAGAVVSEFPLGAPPTGSSFAMRNRIVAGMSQAVVVAESPASGGAMITARFAGEEGRLLFAVPGRIDVPTSAGCHQLIRDGATLLTRVEDLLEEISYLNGLEPGPIRNREAGGAPPRRIDLTDDEHAALGRFADGAVLGADAFARLVGWPAARVAAALMMLEIKQLLVRRLDGAYEKAA
jgi:DNA processing protein